MISMGINKKLNSTPGTLPDVSIAMKTWFQKMTFVKIVKQTIGFEIVEVLEEFNFRGVMQPLGPEELKIKPENERSLKWQMLHAETVLPLATDDEVIYDSIRYRVMKTPNYEKYGYIEYHLVEGLNNDAD